MSKTITEIVSARRAAAELKQKLKGKRNDGMGDYTSIVYGIDIAGKYIELKDNKKDSEYEEWFLRYRPLDKKDELKEKQTNKKSRKGKKKKRKTRKKRGIYF